MSLLVYKFADYDYTAEREQFRNLCKALKQSFDGKDELCIFIANYNIFDCELDAILIKQDSIISVEFKNYGGKVIAVDNGNWKLSDGTVIKGGSRKSVYQQAKINHVAIKRGFIEGGIASSKALKDIASLVVFHQPINLDNRLSSRTQSWLHICDETNFIEKVEDITSKNTCFSNEELFAMLKKLNLDNEYLVREYSNVDFLSDTSQESTTYMDSGICNTELAINNTIYENSDSIINDIDTNTNMDKEMIEQEASFDENEIQEIMEYAELCLSAFLKPGEFTLECKDGFAGYKDFKATKKYIIVVKQKDIAQYKSQIKDFVRRKIFLVSDDEICFDMGDNIGSVTSKNLEVEKGAPATFPSKPKEEKLSFDTHAKLPKYLNDYIYGKDYRASYMPDHQRYEYNKDLSESEIINYLGTYFPRSFGENYCIYSFLLGKEKFKQMLLKQEGIRILDIGCGTGGEILGLLESLKGIISIDTPIDIYAIDGNQRALDILMDLIGKFQEKLDDPIQIQVYTNVRSIEREQDLVAIQNEIRSINFDFIFCDKMCNELISRHNIPTAYRSICDSFAPLLKENGLMQILDVTTKNEQTDQFYSIMLNTQVNGFIKNSNEFMTLLPASCAVHPECNNLCFGQRKFYITHSFKENDLSKIVFRIICRKSLGIELSPVLPVNDEIINESGGISSSDAYCPLVKS